MSANIPVLPIAGSTVLRASFSLLALVTRWLKRLAQAHRHRREAQVLAGLDRHMLADIGITRADVSDAFSEPFWHDPTELLRARVNERRTGRPLPPRHETKTVVQTNAVPPAPYLQPAHRRALPML